MDTNSLFIKEKPVKIILSIRRSRTESYASKIAQDVDTTYAHAVKTLSKMEDSGLLTSKKSGRKKVLELTEKGEQYAETLGEVHDLIYWKEDDESLSIQSVVEGIN